MTRSAASEHDTAAFRELMNRETKGTESQSRMNGGRSGGLKTEWVKAENRRKKLFPLPPLCNRFFPAQNPDFVTGYGIGEGNLLIKRVTRASGAAADDFISEVAAAWQLLVRLNRLTDRSGRHLATSYSNTPTLFFNILE